LGITQPPQPITNFRSSPEMVLRDGVHVSGIPTVHNTYVSTHWTMTYTSYLALVQNTHYDYFTRIDTNYILVYLG
jgi:hypothetical protein